MSVRDKGTAVARVAYVYYDDKHIVNEYIVISDVSSFTEAVRKVEEYYGNDLMELEIRLDCDYPFFFLSKEEFKNWHPVHIDCDEEDLGDVLSKEV